MDFYRQHTF